jgi:hypothetical protein
VQRQASDSLVHRHEPIATFRPLDERAQPIPDQPAATLGIPEVEPAVVHMQHQSAPRAEQPIRVIEDTLALFGPMDHAQGTEQASGIIKRLILQAAQIDDIRLEPLDGYAFPNGALTRLL